MNDRESCERGVRAALGVTKSSLRKAAVPLAVLVFVPALYGGGADAMFDKAREWLGQGSEAVAESGIAAVGQISAGSANQSPTIAMHACCGPPAPPEMPAAQLVDLA